MRLGCDTGGTFTDLVVDTGEELRLFKAATTPEDPVRGVFDVLTVAARADGRSLEDFLRDADDFVHGTTRAINAVVTGSTARTALLATAGHRDMLVFREGGRADAFDHTRPYPAPLVPRSLTFEVRERIGADGHVLEPLDEAALSATLRELAEHDVEAIAVALLWSIVEPRHELRVGDLIAEHLPGVPYTLSHQINPTLREYRRASSTCIDASLKPLMTAYFSSLTGRLREAGFGGRVLVATSQGGMLDAGEVAARPIHSLNSGPAMAPVAGRHFAAAAREESAIVMDTGGTTCDVSVVRRGRIPWTRETWIGPPREGHITGFPSVGVTSVGAGGGSIAWVDEGGLLRVGPLSAGSVPGPACYGRGGSRPTLTDACLVLGYLNPSAFLGGTMTLDTEAARTAVEELAAPLGVDVQEAAAAVLTIATSNMLHAIEDVTVAQGIDPAETVLVAGGGAAGFNAVEIARRLACRRLIVPEVGAALSAAGALLSDLSTDFSTTLFAATEAFDAGAVNAALAELTVRCRDFLATAGDGAGEIEYRAEGRYPHQVWEIDVPVRSGTFADDAAVEQLASDFHGVHRNLFGIADEGSSVELVSWRASARVTVHDGATRPVARPNGPGAADEARRAYFPGAGWQAARAVHAGRIAPGEQVAGPALIESPLTTIVMDGDAVAERGADGTLSIRLTR
ncbi:hydantoinase/oxoprolinase family protein [Conexibacter woesei]|uniref:5-oxoprolinase (ATP-hydrolyzing) n=1 Tax=Conexibacter woesei (strain DSM 14684 / CCUG 47730 / CIP 108061 / JCM 11494 / NBRC 100937 / ID131577) TaxID=469383 RepID=D3F705_CONWI|nr:hydantoinase/oxoprolinase family protein [Conexibacter woesei]ADB52803.1 5-oxoprolinase (ATP-hydrolyzing) [Conexibacter woesei DSM 14684]